MIKNKLKSTFGFQILGYIIISVLISVFSYNIIFLSAMSLIQDDIDEIKFSTTILETEMNKKLMYYEVMEARLQSACVIAALIIGIVTFLLLIQIKIDYIKDINQKVSIFQEELIPITIDVMGNDELSILAKSINEMEEKISDYIEFENRLRYENIQFLTELAHDIRTPLTSVISYLEFAIEEYSKENRQENNYLNIAHEKAIIIKELTDRLFFSCKNYNSQVSISEEIDICILLSQIISDSEDNLIDRGFKIEIKENSLKSKILLLEVGTIQRIFENITSNILKYANPDYPIFMELIQNDNKIIFTQRNVINKKADVESNKIGLKIIEKLVTKCGGKVEFNIYKNKFEITVIFD